MNIIPAVIDATGTRKIQFSVKLMLVKIWNSKYAIHAVLYRCDFRSQRRKILYGIIL